MTDIIDRRPAAHPVADSDREERARLALARPGLLREAAWIGGEWVEAAARIAVANPATGRNFATALGQAARRAVHAAAGLAAYPFTRDTDRVARVSEALEYGRVGVNTGLISTVLAPFGGMKESGLGREGSHYGIEEFLDIGLVCRNIGVLR